jgi:heme oxygenase
MNEVTSQSRLHQSAGRFRTLRQHLGEATANLHDDLETALSPLALGDTNAFINYLQIQHSARACIEEWFDSQSTHISNVMPRQAPLIESDLAALNAKFPQAADTFRTPRKSHILGAMWAMAATSLGNQMILVHRRKAGLMTPAAFLADQAMPALFSRLRPSLDVPCPPDNAESVMRSAMAVFEVFTAAVERHKSPLPEDHAAPAHQTQPAQPSDCPNAPTGAKDNAKPALILTPAQEIPQRSALSPIAASGTMRSLS